MFESVTPDPGSDALVRAARIFRVLALLIVLSSVFFTALDLIDGRPPRVVLLTINAVLSVVTWFTAGAIEDQKNWARWVGFAVGLLELVNVPVGTVIGIAILVYLIRASRAGLFRSRASSAEI